jgi:hypothetical protein
MTITFPNWTAPATLALCGFLAWLKVLHGAAIGWLVVFAPIWLPIAIVLGIGIVFVVGLFILGAIGAVLR